MVDRTVSPSGRSFENENPVPPPDWCTRGHRAQGVVDPAGPVGERVVDGKHEARRQLPQGPARVHERGGVGLEPARGHELVEAPRHLFDSRVRGPVLLVLIRDDPGNAPEHRLRLLRRLAGLVLLQVAPGKDDAGVLREPGGRQVVRDRVVKDTGVRGWRIHRMFNFPGGA